MLFTGKATVEYGGLAGTTGAVCKYNGYYSYALTATRNPDGTPRNPNTIINTVGHEIGHLLGARHTADIPNGSPCLSVPIYTDDLMNMGDDTNPNMGFHECAKREMNWHLWFHNSCLVQAGCN